MVRSSAIAIRQAVDELGAAKPLRSTVNHRDVVATLPQASGHLRRKARLQRQRVVWQHLPTRRIRCRLRVLPQVEDAMHHLHMPLMLHVPAHHAKAHARRPGFRDEAGDDGVVRPLAATHLVGMARFKREAAPPVLHGDAGVRHHDARTKPHVVGLDEAHHAPGGVRGGEIHRVLAGRQRGRRGWRGLGADAARGPLDGAFFQQFRDGDAHGAWLGEVVERGADGDLHRLDLQVYRFHAVCRQAGQVESPQQGKGDLRRQPLAVGGQFMERYGAVILCRGRHPFRGMAGKVVQAHGAAVCRGIRGDGFRQGAAIEGFAAALGYLGEGTRRGRQPHPLPRLRRLASGREVLEEVRKIRIDVQSHAPVAGGDVAHLKALLRVANGALEERLEGQRAEPLR